MDDRPLRWSRGDYLVSTDRGRLDVRRVLALLRTTHWADGLTEPLLERAIAHSVSFGLFRGADLVGFGRVITDLATYGYLTDVVVATPHRGQGLGAWLTECMLGHPELQGSVGWRWLPGTRRRCTLSGASCGGPGRSSTWSTGPRGASRPR